MSAKKIFILLINTVFLSAFYARAQSPLINMKRADSLFFAQNWPAAQKMYNLLIKDSTRNAIAWNRFGFSNYHTGFYAEALKDYQKALANKPSPGVKASVYSRIARIEALQNNIALTCVHLDSAITNGYVNVAELDSLNDFATVRHNENFKQLRQKAYVAANPCMANAQTRQFDFWLGEWNVYAAGTNTLVGHSLVQMVSGGCALLENWDATGGASTGKSLNFVDGTTGKWKQTWVGNYTNGVQEFVNGEYKDGAMRFTFTTTNAQGNTIAGRFVFFNEGPGQVRQFNETSADGGKTWTTAYNFTYIRVKK